MLTANVVRVLQLVAEGKNPRREFSPNTVARCFKELRTPPGVMIRRGPHGRYEATERGRRLLQLLEETEK